MTYHQLMDTLMGSYPAKQRVMAPTTKWTDERVERIMEALSSWQTGRVAAGCGGVLDDTLRHWIMVDTELSLCISAAESQT